MVMETQRQALLGERGAKLLSLAVRRYDANAFIPQPRCMLASELIGRRIDYRDGRRAGQVVDLVFSLDEGRLRYVMTEIAGKPYAVPLDALQVPRAPGRQVMLKAGALSGADG
jgi:hypothetical protein